MALASFLRIYSVVSDRVINLLYVIRRMVLKVFNYKDRKISEFKPIKASNVGFYSCGPTVYWYPHVGNMRTYIFKDILKRVLSYNGFKVKHVMNYTDVGHLTSDSDTGEDKMERQAKKENKNIYQIARFYTKDFL